MSKKSITEKKDALLGRLMKIYPNWISLENSVKIDVIREQFYKTKNYEDKWMLCKIIKDIDLKHKTGDLADKINESCKIQFNEAQKDNAEIKVFWSIYNNTGFEDSLRNLILKYIFKKTEKRTDKWRCFENTKNKEDKEVFFKYLIQGIYESSLIKLLDTYNDESLQIILLDTICRREDIDYIITRLLRAIKKIELSNSLSNLIKKTEHSSAIILMLHEFFIQKIKKVDSFILTSDINKIENNYKKFIDQPYDIFLKEVERQRKLVEKRINKKTIKNNSRILIENINKEDTFIGLLTIGRKNCRKFELLDSECFNVWLKKINQQAFPKSLERERLLKLFDIYKTNKDNKNIKNELLSRFLKKITNLFLEILKKAKLPKYKKLISDIKNNDLPINQDEVNNCRLVFQKVKKNGILDEKDKDFMKKLDNLETFEEIYNLGKEEEYLFKNMNYKCFKSWLVKIMMYKLPKRSKGEIEVLSQIYEKNKYLYSNISFKKMTSKKLRKSVK